MNTKPTVAKAGFSPPSHSALPRSQIIGLWSAMLALFISHTLAASALASAGTVVAWGRNDAGEASVPAGLDGVSAIAAGSDHVVALKNDGSLVAWGGNNNGQSTVPTGLGRVTAIAAGTEYTVVLKNRSYRGGMGL